MHFVGHKVNVLLKLKCYEMTHLLLLMILKCFAVVDDDDDDDEGVGDVAVLIVCSPYSV